LEKQGKPKGKGTCGNLRPKVKGTQCPWSEVIDKHKTRTKQGNRGGKGDKEWKDCLPTITFIQCGTELMEA